MTQMTQLARQGKLERQSRWLHLAGSKTEMGDHDLKLSTAGRQE
jgi:hypothetical protein